MKIIDLSQTLENNMPVFPGDPEVVYEALKGLKANGYKPQSEKWIEKFK
ncbi:hypothetical protein HN803_00475 [candidate division WWE3 bacterium]|jgi:kynurenine formamidase|nr:hypothetical protein [candidate division WWE3 bacterium]MBT7349259.1 hypothetical protein [candidate division WWE3 bacterium]